MLAFTYRDINFGWVRESGRWQLLLVCIGYLLIIYITNRLFVTGPARQKALRELDEERREIELDRNNSSLGVSGLLDRAYDVLGFPATLTSVVVARRYLHSCQRIRTRYDTESHVALGRLASQRLKKECRYWPPLHQREAEAVSLQIDNVLDRLDKEGATPQPAQSSGQETAAVGSLRIELALLTTEAMKVTAAVEDEKVEGDADVQRRALWLAYAGLAAILVIGTYGPRVPLLFGALGGFLAPVIRMRRARTDANDYRTSWALLLLGPVAGALAAYAGLLVLQFLADPSVSLLGPVFKDRFGHPHTTTAKVLALLLGYSGTLFAFLAGTALDAIEKQPPPGGGGGPTGPSGGGPAVADASGGTASLGRVTVPGATPETPLAPAATPQTDDVEEMLQGTPTVGERSDADRLVRREMLETPTVGERTLDEPSPEQPSGTSDPVAHDPSSEEPPQ